MIAMTTSPSDIDVYYVSRDHYDGPGTIPETIHLPCGACAHFCYEAGHGYRCEDCMAVVGSIAQPSECVDAANKYSVVLKALGSNIQWNYEQGREEEKPNKRTRNEY